MLMIGDLRARLEQKKGQQTQLKQTLQLVDNRIKELHQEIKFSQQAQLILQCVARKTQEQLEYRVSELVSLALAAVFDQPYQLKVQFVVRRGKTECDILFEKDGMIYEPLTASGGGVIDIASFALRVALWSLAHPQSSNVLLLDEPFRFLSRDLQPRASLMLKAISDKLGIQIIMSSHSSDLIEGADKVFEVTKDNKVTRVIEAS